VADISDSFSIIIFTMDKTETTIHSRTDGIIDFVKRNKEMIDKLKKCKIEIDCSGKSTNSRITAFDIDGEIFHNKERS